MAKHKQDEFHLDIGKKESPHPTSKNGLTIAASASKPLSQVQVEFNKRMAALEKQRVAHERERARLDKELRVSITELMPLLEATKRAERDLIFAAELAYDSFKLTKKRRKWFGDLISGKAQGLLHDPVGMGEEDLQHLESLVEKLGPSVSEQEREELERAELDEMRWIVEAMARSAGVDLDLSDLDIRSDPAEFERMLYERFEAAKVAAGQANPEDFRQERPKRKPSKAAMDRERLKREAEEAKSRDFKSLYKQLAKVLHPDLEPDPELKAHKQQWMARLTNARDHGDLREMLAIEMEWLGEESEHLAQASDEKLRVYSMVLKEQLADLKEQTRMLACEPQYQPLMRFRGPFGTRRTFSLVKLDLFDERSRLEEMVAVLSSGGGRAQSMIHQWADAHARTFC